MMPYIIIISNIKIYELLVKIYATYRKFHKRSLCKIQQKKTWNLKRSKDARTHKIKLYEPHGVQLLQSCHTMVCIIELRYFVVISHFFDKD